MTPAPSGAGADAGAGAGAAFVAPMLAQPLRMPSEARLLSGEWVYERKLDGLRCIAVRSPGRVELWSRNHLPFDRRFPEIAAAMAQVAAGSFVVDGEIVAFEGDRTSFELLQGGSATATRVFVAFDLLHLLGRDTTVLALGDRSRLLRQCLEGAPGAIRVSEQLTGDPESLLRSACESGWEGLVAKRAGSMYRSGRSPDWRKLKCSARQELVVGGWSDPSGSRAGFGALLMGYFEGDQLRYAGKVGTGFDEKTLRSLSGKMRELQLPESPFSEAIPRRGVHWVQPSLVAEIEFTEWTRDGRMRHPRYLGLRPDKTAREVRRETPPGA